MPFQPGQSGNPGGRPKDDPEVKEVKELAKQKSKRAIERLVEWMESENPKASVAACNSIMDRGIGKPAQDLTISGNPDAPLQTVTKVELVNLT